MSICPICQGPKVLCTCADEAEIVGWDEVRKSQNKERVILHLYADLGSDSKPYKDNGYTVRLVGKNIGVENFVPEKPWDVYGIIANPVCTEFSIARGFHKRGDTVSAFSMVEHCFRIIRLCKNLKFWVIENPATGRLKEYLGTPKMIYEPWQFGDPWTKKTALWGNFVQPKPKYTKWADVPKNNNLYIRPGRKKPGIAFLHKSAKQFIPDFSNFNVEDDMSFRSLCPQGFARAFFEVNK